MTSTTLTEPLQSELATIASRFGRDSANQQRRTLAVFDPLPRKWRVTVRQAAFTLGALCLCHYVLRRRASR